MTMLCAHRGLSAEEPENTVPAFQAAVAAGFDAIELDVRITHDGEIVVMHDANIARTTDGVGRVSDFDFPELRTHDTAGGPIPTLREAFDCVGDWDGFWDIEVKAWRAAALTADIIRECGVAERSVLSAMDPRALHAAQDAGIPRGLITLGPPDADDLDAAQETECTWLLVDHGFLTPEIHDTARDGGMKLGAWTVNDVAEAKRIASDVDLLITDTRDVLQALR